VLPITKPAAAIELGGRIDVITLTALTVSLRVDGEATLTATEFRVNLIPKPGEVTGFLAVYP
jgi:hypothetical protein